MIIQKLALLQQNKDNYSMESPNPLCKNTSIKFTFQNKKEGTKLVKEHPLNRIRIKKSTEYEKSVQKLDYMQKQTVSSAQRILTQRVTTRGCGFNINNSKDRSIEKNHNINTQIDQHKIKSSLKFRIKQRDIYGAKLNCFRRNKSLNHQQSEDVKIAINYTNYYTCASNNKKIQCFLQEKSLSNDQEKLEFSPNAKSGHFPKKSCTFNTAIYQMLRDYKKKIRRKSRLQSQDNRCPKIDFPKKNDSTNNELDKPVIKLTTTHQNINFSPTIDKTEEKKFELGFSCLQNYLRQKNFKKQSKQNATKTFSPRSKVKNLTYANNQEIKQKIKRLYKNNQIKQKVCVIKSSTSNDSVLPSKLFNIEKSYIYTANNFAGLPSLSEYSESSEHTKLQKKIIVETTYDSNREQSKYTGKSVKINFINSKKQKNKHTETENNPKCTSILSGWEIEDPEEIQY